MTATFESGRSVGYFSLESRFVQLELGMIALPNERRAHEEVVGHEDSGYENSE
jgi:hypothetical protein